MSITNVNYRLQPTVNLTGVANQTANWGPSRLPNRLSIDCLIVGPDPVAVC